MNMFIPSFVSLVRPRLEYASVVWKPFFKKDIKTIEKVQKRRARVIPALWDLDYEDRLMAKIAKPCLSYISWRHDSNL